MKSIKTRITLVDLHHPDTILMHTIDRHLLRSMVVLAGHDPTEDAFIRRGTVLQIAGNQYEVKDMTSCFYDETKDHSGQQAVGRSQRYPYNAEVIYFLNQL